MSSKQTQLLQEQSQRNQSEHNELIQFINQLSQDVSPTSKLQSTKHQNSEPEIIDAIQMTQQESITTLLERAWLSDEKVFTHLYYIIFESMKVACNGEDIPDYHARLNGIKTWRRIKWFGRKKLVNGNESLYVLMDEKGLDAESVFWVLNEIMHKAYDIIKIRLWDEYEYKVQLLHSLQESAIKEYSLIKSYISDDKVSILNFFNVDADKMSKILAITC